jgi:hypothetical protein
MALTAAAERAFLSESVGEVAIDLVSFEHESLGAIRLCSNTVPITSRGNVYSPAPLIDVKLAPSQPGQFPAVDFEIGVNDQTIVSALRSIDDSPTVRYEIVLASDPDTVQKGIGALKIESVEIGILRLRMTLGVFPLFQVIGPKRAYTPDIAPGAHI